MEVKYSAPSKFNPAPYGEMIKVIGETVNDMVLYTYYIQISQDSEKPQWIELGDLLSVVFEHKLHDKNWISECLNNYNNLLKEAS